MQGPFFRGSFWNHTTNHIGGNCYGRKKRIQRSHRRGYLQKRKECTNAQSQLIITLNEEKAQQKAEEEAFMAEEMKKLQKRYQKEKEEIHARFVAERKVGYGV